MPLHVQHEPFQKLQQASVTSLPAKKVLLAPGARVAKQDCLLTLAAVLGCRTCTLARGGSSSSPRRADRPHYVGQEDPAHQER